MSNAKRNARRVLILSTAAATALSSVTGPLLTRRAQAANVYWDSDTNGANDLLTGSGLGGTGTWNTSTSATPLSNWWPGTGTVDQQWNNANNDTAIFSGTAGTVTLGDAVAVGGLTFNTTGYTITGSGANTLTLGATSNSIDLNGALGETISAQLAGSNGFTLNGFGAFGSGTSGGILTLSSTTPLTEALTGTININNGELQVFSQNVSLQNTTNINFGGTGTFRYDNTGATANVTQSLGALSFTGGDGTVTNGHIAQFNTFLNFASLSTRSTGAVGLFVDGGTTATNGTNVKTTFGSFGSAVVPSNSLIDPGLFFSGATVGPYGFAAYDTAGFVRALNYTGDANAVTVAAGTTLGSNTGKDVQMTGAITAQGTDNVNTLNISGASNLTLTVGATLGFGEVSAVLSGQTGVGAILKTGGNAATISGGAGITANVSGGELIIRTDLAADALTISTPILNGTGALTKSGAGTLTLTAANAYTGSTFINAGTLVAQGPSALPSTTGVVLTGGTLSLQDDGDGLGDPQNINLGQNVTDSTGGGITVGRLGATALNKTIQLGSLTIGNQILTVTPNNGYGLQFTGSTTLTDIQPTTINVAGTQASNIVAGLTLSGIVSDTSGSLVGLTKTGTGTLVLGNSGNSFGDGSTIIDIQGGILSVGSDGALGAGTNTVVLDTNSATQGLRLTATNTYSHTIVLGQATNDIEVTSGAVATLGSALSIPIASSVLTKNDDGTLVFSVSNPANWSGGILINAGAVRVSDPSQVGTGTISVAGAVNTGGAALQLVGGFTLPNAIVLNTSNATNIATGGINFGGQLESVSGTNTVTGVLTLNADASIGADAGSILNNNTGGINNPTTTARALVFTGAGTINLNANITSATATANQYFSLVKFGTGTLNITTAESIIPTSNFTVWGGILDLTGTIVGGNTIAATVQGGSLLKLDDSGTATPNRLGGRPLTLVNGTFEYTANSAGSSETLGTLTAGWGNDTLQVDSSSGNTTVTFGALAANVVNGGADLVFQTGGGSANFGTASNTVKFTTAPTLTSNLINRGLVLDGNGINFATYSATTGVQAYAAYNNTGAYTDINAAAATDTVKIGSGFLAGSTINASAKTLNAVDIAGSGLTLDASANSTSTLTLTTGEILDSGGANLLGSSGTHLIAASGGTELGVSVATGSELDVNATFTNSNNFTKGLGGLLKFNAPQFFNTGGNYLTINAGIVVLNGGTNTLFTGVQGGTAGSFMAISNGATLDLNGNSQLIGGLRNPNNTAVVNAGGSITNSGAAAVLAIGVGQTDNWGGVISGAISIAKAGNAAEVFSNNNTYTGATSIMGNTFTLNDFGQLSGTSVVNVSYGILAISDNGQTALPSRVNSSAPINFRGGEVSYTGRSQTASSQTLGTLSLIEGASELTVAGGGTGVNSADLIFSSLVQQSRDATLNIHLFGQIGSNPRIELTSAPTVVNNIITTAVESGGADWATYIPALGLTSLGAAGAPAYDGTVLPGGNQPTQNIKLAAAGTIPNGGLLLNTLNTSGANVTYTTGTNTLNLVAGGLMHTGASSTFGATVDSGLLTAGGATPSGTVPFYVYNVANTFTINSRIVDPTGSNPLRLVMTNFNGGIISLTDANTYTGGTVLNGWIGNNTGGVSLGGAAGTVVIPAGGVTISNGIFTEATNGGQINPANTVTLNGSSTFTLAANNTLAGIVFNNDGGAGTPTVATGGTLFLTGATPISTLTGTPPTNYETIPTLSGVVDFQNNAKTIFVDPITVGGVANIAPYTPGINISAVIQNSGLITKTGLGNLELSGVNTFTGGVNLSAGSLIIGGSSTPSTVGSTVTSGPLGTGTLTIGSGTTLLSTAADTLANSISLPGNVNFNGLNNLTLNGNVAIGAGVASTVNVVAPQMTTTLGGVVGGSGSSIVKSGLGTLVLNNNNTFTGGVTLNSGTLLASGPNSNTVSPLGTGLLTLNGGNLQLRNNGVSNNSSITLGNNVTINSSVANAFIDINNNGANTGNTFVFGTLTENPTTILNVTGGNNYKLQFTGTNLTSAFPNTPASFNPGAGLTLILPGGFTDSNRPINIGAGTLSFSGNNSFTSDTTITGTMSLSPQANTISTPGGTGAYDLSNGSTLQVVPLANTLSNPSNTYITGGLAGHYFQFGAAPTLNTVAASGLVAGGVVGGVPSSDANLSNHPIGISTASGSQNAQDVEQYVGLLKITGAGTYNFELAKDDQGVVFVDGARVAAQGDGVVGAAGGWAGFATGSIILTAGLHSIVVMHENGAGGSGIQVLYNGPDTAGTPGAGWQGISPSNLLYNTAGLATAANGYLNAAQINNAVNLAAGNTATLDGQTSQYNSTFASLNLGNGSTLNVTNLEGTGFIGSVGTTTVGSGVTINANGGILDLIGGVSDTPGANNAGATGTSNGLTKIGTGTLMLGASGGTFTGNLNVLQGGLTVADPAALPSAGASTIIGSANISNSGGATSITTTVGTAVTLAAGTTAGLFVGEGVSGTNIPAGDTIASITDTTHFVLTTAATAAATVTPTYFAGAVLDLNGISNVAGNITINGNGPLNQTTTAPGSLYNSSASAASATGTITIGTPINGKNPTISGYGDIILGGTVQDGSIAGQGWNKAGPDILTLSGNNTFTGVVSIAAAGGLKLGNAAALGGVPAGQSGQAFTTSATINDSSTTGLAVGMVVSGTGIPFGDTIASIVPGNSFTLTTAPTAAGTGLTFAAPVVAATGSFIDLNGQSISTTRQLTLAGLGATGLANNNTLGALINTSATAATFSGNISLTGAVGIGSSNFDNSIPGGDITLTGTIGPAVAGVGINKVGLDTLTVQGNIISTTGGYNIQQGTFVLSGANGAFTAGAPLNISSGATVKLDNTSANVAGGRLGLALSGGETINGNLTIIGNSNSAGTTELLSTATNGKITFSNSGSVITLQPDSTSGGLRFDLTSGIALARTAGATSLFRGNNLGTVALTSVAATTNTAGFGDGTQANPGFVGSTTTTGTNRGVLPWALVDTTNGGTGTSLAAYDTTNGFRALNFATDGVTNALTAGTNVLSTTGVTTTAASGINAINSFTLNGGGATVSAGSTLQITSGGLLNLSGTTSSPNTISGPGILSTGANVELILHSTTGNVLNITSQIAGTTGALTKADGGNVILGAKELYLGNTFVNGGILQLNGGNNTMFVASNLGQAPGATGFASNSEQLQLNLGGTLDLNGTTQMVANLNSANPLPNTGGILTNTSGTTSTFQMVENANQTFAGSINGNLNLIRASGFTYTFESASNFIGSTTIQGGQTILQDLAAFTGTTQINLNGGALTWNDTGTQALANRLPSATPITFNTGAFTYLARSGVQGAASIGNATLNSGSSLITVTPLNGGANLTIGTGTGLSLTHNVGGTVTFFSGGAVAAGSTAAGNFGGIGDNAHVFLANQPLGFVGGWATVYQVDTAVGQVTEPGFAINTSNGLENLNPDLVTIATGSVTSGVNARINAAAVTLPGPTTLNSLSIINAATVLSFTASTDTLTLTSGGLLTGADGNNKSIGQSAGFGNLTAGAGQPELFIHVGANTLTVNSTITDNGVSGGLNVVADPMAGAGALTLTAANSYLGTTYLNNINTTLNSALGPAIPGNLVMTGGVSAADSLNVTTTLAANNQIATGSTVTLKGGATLNLAGFTNTIANLTFDNTSGDLNGIGGTIQTGIGNLTVSGAISETNNTDSFLVPQINGFLTLSNATPTISVAANPTNPAEVGLNLGAVISLTAPTTTPLSLTGGGVIGITGQSLFANGISVAGGTTLAFGQESTSGAAATFPSVVNSQVNLASGATLDMRGFNGVIGSLTGSGVVTNTISATNTGGTLTTGNTATLTTGADNVALAQFDGTFTSPFAQSLLNVTKIGTGTMLLTADNSNAGANSGNVGTLTVSGGTVLLNGTTAKLGFTNDAVQAGGTLTLDNTTNPLSNRLGGQFLLPSATVTANTVRTLTTQGGTFNVLGNNGTTITEGVGQLNPSNGGIINLSALNTSGVVLSVVNFTGQGGQSSLRINANNLGIAAPNTAGDANVTVSGTYATPGTQGAGTAGSTLLPIRPDIIATDTVSNVTGFVFNAGTNGLRLLNPATEYLTTTSGLASSATIAAANAFNLALSSTSAQQTLISNTPVGSLTLQNGGGLTNGLGTTGGSFGGAGFETLTLGSGGLLALNGNAGINIAAVTSIGVTMDIHVVGAGTTLAFNSAITGTTSGIVKADDGTLSFNQPQFFTGANGTNGLTINGGKVVLNSGAANTILVAPTAAVPTVQSLFMNSSTGILDLNGQSQAFERISSINPLPGQGGTITSAAAANLITVPATTVVTTYSGSIGGAISLFKEGAGATTGSLTLTSSNGYTGSTNIVGGTLALRDSGALTGTSAININYGQLTLDNTGLSDSTSRISSSVPINMNGGTFTVAGRQAIENESIGTVTLTQGVNQFTTTQFANNAQTGSYSLTIGNLVQSNNSTLVFTNGAGVTYGQPGGNPHIFLTQLNGQNPVTVAAANNGILGGWAIADSGLDFAGYTAATGVGGLSTAGFPAYGALGGGATVNASVGATVQSVLGQTINSVAVRAPGAATTIGMFDQSQVLNIGTGGLLFNDSGAKGVTLQGGQLTAGGAAVAPASLFIYTNSNTQVINSQIVNNGSNVVTLVRSGGGTITLTPQVVDTVATIAAASNTFNVNNAQGLFVGMAVTGTGLPAGEFITGISANAITVTTGTGVTAATNSQVTFAPPASAATSGTTINTPTVTTAANAFAGGAAFLPTVGMAIGGPAIPGGTTIQSFTGTNATGFTFTLSQNAIASSATAVVTVGAESNTYTGPTINNGGSSIFGTLNLTGQPGSIVIPGDLNIGNAGVTEVTNQGQIAATSNVTWVSGGTLTLVGTNTLNSLTFNGNGTSGGTGTAAVGTLLNVSASNAITAINNDLGHTPTVSGTALALTSAIPTINTSGLSSDDLIISAPIVPSVGGQIQKTGAGALVLSGASTFTTGINLQAGSIIFAASSTGTVTSGPAGTGTLVLNGIANSTILSDANRTIANAVTVNGGGFTFGGDVAVNGLTLSGPVTLGAGANSINVTAPTVPSAISGVITGGTNLTKIGQGILTLSNAANTYGGLTIVAGGVLKSGNATPFPLLSQVQVNQGAEFDINATNTTIASLVGDSATTGGLVTDSGATATLSVGADNLTTPNFAGIITNAAAALALTKVGTGNQTLSGQNLFTGAVSIPDGQLTITNSNALGTGTKTVSIINNSGFGSGALHLNPGAGPAIVLPATISFSTSNTAATMGAIVNDNGNNVVNGNFTITSGGGATSLGATAGTLTLNGTFTPNTTARQLSFRGNGNVVVTATNAFVDTALNQLPIIKDYGTGTLTISGTSANGLIAASTLADNSGTILLNGAGKVAFNAYTVSGGATLALDNSGTLTAARLSPTGVSAVNPLTLNGGIFTINGNAGGAASQTLSTLTLGSGGSTIGVAGTGGQGTNLTATTFAAPVAGGSALVTGDSLAALAGPGVSSFVATTFNVQAGQTVVGAATDANGQLTKAIRADVIADATGGLGSGFLTKDSVSGTLRPLTTGELSSTLSNSLTTNFGNFGSTQNYASSLGVNSLTLLNGGQRIVSTGGGQGVQTVNTQSVVQEYTNAATLNTITVNTGGVLVTNTGSVNVGALTTTGNAPFIFHVTGASPLATVFDMTGYLTSNTGGLTKADGGTLRLDSPEFYSGTTTVNAGALVLNSGAANTIEVIPTATTPTVQNLQVNGGTLDLNGQNQAFGFIQSNDYVPGTGGNITSATAASLVSATGTSTTFSGVIGGAISFSKAGTGTLTLSTPQTYTGTTNVQGGTLVLVDSGAIASNTVNVNGATLQFNDNNIVLNTARIPTGASETLNNGTLTILPPGVLKESISLATTGGAAVALNTGNNAINAGANMGTAGITNPGAVVLNVGTLTRQPGAAVTFAGFNLGQTGILSQFGLGTAQIFLNNINGTPTANGFVGGWATVAPQLLQTTTTASTTVNLVAVTGGITAANLYVGEAVSGTGIPVGDTIASIPSPTGTSIVLTTAATAAANTNLTFGTTDFAAYSVTNGLGGVGTPNFLAYSSTNLNSAGSTDNVKINATPGANVAAGATINSLNVANPANLTTVTLAGGMTIGSGGLIFSDPQAKGISLTGGSLTAGTTSSPAELFAYVNTSTAAQSISSQITDNGASGSVSLVKNGTGNLVLSPTVADTYTGTTYANQGTLTLGAAASTVVVPGNLVINSGATVIESTNAGQIAATTNVAINGAGVLTLTGSNTLNNLTINNNGGTLTPTVNAGTTLTLTGNISEPNDNLATTSTITGGTVALTGSAPTITTSGLSPDDLIIASLITSTNPITKLGTGSLVLPSNNTAALNWNLAAGSLILNNAGALGTTAGSLTVSGAGTLQAGTAALTTNAIPVTVSPGGSLTFGGVVATNSLNLAGAVSLPAGANTITVSSPLVTGTISGQLTGGTNLTKSGPGILALANGTNNYGGTTTVAGGILQLGNAAGVPAGSGVQVNSGAEFDIAGKAGSIGSLAGDSATTGGMVTNSGAAAVLTIGNDNTNQSFAGLITNATNSLSLTKVGTGTQALSGANTYTGPTTINNGILLANTSIPTASATGSGAVTVNTGGTLAGGSSNAPGFIASLPTNTAVTVTSGAFISAGNGVSTTSTTGLLVTSGGTAPTTYSHVWTGNGNYQWKVNGTATTGSTPVQVSNGGATVGTTDTAGGANWDMLAVQTLNVTATSTTPFNINVVPLTSSTGFNPGGVYTWTIADVTGANGIYLNGANDAGTLQGATTSPFGALLAALNLNASQLSTLYGASASGFSLGVTSDGGAGEDIVINYNAAPEPTSLMLLGLGAGGLLLRRRRRQTV
jgi:autotransporter-associated beta strand protein